MPELTDPSEALRSFQQALKGGEVIPQPGTLDPSLFVFLDHPTGTPRFTYAHLDRSTVTALAILALCEPIDGVPCFQLGYAVPEKYRRQGRAKRVAEAAIAEMTHGFGRAGVPEFYIEAVVSLDNKPSKRIAEQVISSDPVEGTDELAGKPVLQYVRRVLPASK